MKSLRRTACVIACIAVFLASLTSLAACAEDNTDDGNSATGYSLSGKITLDGQGLGGVGILVDGETSARSDANGVFSVSHLAYGDEVAFALEAVSLAPAVSRTAGICAGFDGGTARAAVRSFCLDYVPPEAAVERPIRPR